MDCIGAQRRGVGNTADAGGRDEDAVGRAVLHHFGVAGDDINAGLPGGRGHRIDNGFEVAAREPLFNDERGAQTQGRCPTHCQVIDCAVDGKGADVAAGELPRADHISVSGHAQAGCVSLHHRPVAQLRKHVIAQPGEECFRNQLIGQQTAVAMCQQNGFLRHR